MTAATVAIDAAALGRLFADFNRTDAPGLVAGVSHPRAGSWKAGFGLASLEQPVVNTPRTRLRIGSTSKMFTCLAVMLLQEEGRISIDQSVRTWFPELPAWAEPMTPRHFMTHTSGMRCHIDLLFQFGSFAREAPAQTGLELLRRQHSVNFAVGERYSYNNGGYNLLSILVERITGQDFGAFLEARVFRPLGMLDTAVKRSDTEMLPNSASLHVRRTDGSFTRGMFGVSIAGEGAMVSTVEDMLVWLKHMHRPTIGSAETWREMRASMRLNSGAQTGYGFGLFTHEYRGVQVLHHAGGVNGGVCMCLTAPEHELDIILIGNRSDAPLPIMAFEVIDACITGLAPKPEPVAGLAHPGTFRCAETGLVLGLEAAEEGAVLTLMGARAPLRRRSAAELVAVYPGSMQVITQDGPDRLVVASLGARDVYERITPLETALPGEADALTGLFTSDENELLAEIRQGEAGLTLRFDGAFGRDLYGLAPLAPGLWTSRCLSNPETGHGGILEAQAAEDGRIAGFTYTTPRTRRLPFTRLPEGAPAILTGRTLQAM